MVGRIILGVPLLVPMVPKRQKEGIHQGWPGAGNENEQWCAPTRTCAIPHDSSRLPSPQMRHTRLQGLNGQNQAIVIVWSGQHGGTNVDGQQGRVWWCGWMQQGRHPPSLVGVTVVVLVVG